MKEKIENALRLKKTNSSLVNENYYKSKENWTGARQTSTKPNFVYELIPTDNYEKNNKKTFSVNPEKNLIDTCKIETILKNTEIPLQEKVKNFDIQFEEKIEEFRTLKNENFYFTQQFSKFYRNGEPQGFEPFQTQNEKANEIQKLLEKKIFDEIILAYEKKNYKIPEFVRKNIFEISPMLVDLRKIKEFYNVSQRLENPNFLKDIRKMLKINESIKSEGLENLKEFAEFCEEDFLLEKDKDKEKLLLRELKQKNKIECEGNLKLKDYLEIQAEELRKVLGSNEFLKQIAESEQEDKENVNPNVSSSKKQECDKRVLNIIIENVKNNLNLNNINIGSEINSKANIHKKTLIKSKEKPLVMDLKNKVFEKESRNSLIPDKSILRESSFDNPKEKIGLEIENISPIRKQKVENLNKIDSTKEIKDSIYEISPEPKKTQKCFKTLGSLKKKMKKQSVNGSNMQEIQLNSFNGQSIIELKKCIFPKAKVMKEQLKNAIKNKSQNEGTENEDPNDNLKKILTFQIFDESNIIRIENNNNNNNYYNKNQINNLNQSSIFNVNNYNNFNKSCYIYQNIKEKEKEIQAESQSENKKERKIINISCEANLNRNGISIPKNNLTCYENNNNNNYNNNNYYSSSKKNLLTTSSKITSSGNINSATEDSTTKFSSNDKKTNLESNSQNLSSHFSISNKKTSGMNTFNNFSVSDFASKISNEISQMQNTVNNNNFINNNNNKNEDSLLLNNRKNSNFIINEKNAFAVNLPKGFNKDSVSKLNKKVLPIKLTNLNELKKIEAADQARKLSLINLKDDRINEIEELASGINKEQEVKKDVEAIEANKTETNKFKKFEKKETKENSTFDDNNNKNNNCFSDRQVNEINNTVVSGNENENCDKEVYLEKLFKKISNKNFQNLKKDLDQYVELFSSNNSRLKNEVEFLKNKSVEPTNFFNRIKTLKSKVKNEDFDDKIANICAENGILNINPDGINKIKKLDEMIFKMDFDLVKKIV